MKWAERRAAAEAAARAGGALALERLSGLAGLVVEKKGLQDYVSAADREVEALIKARLLEQFPEDGFLGEELGASDGRGVWVVDPIDGTSNYLRDIPLFGVSIAYWVAGEPVVGVIFDPSQDELYAATKAQGATKNGSSIHVRAVSGLDDAVITLGFNTAQQKEPLLRATETFLARGAEFRRFGAAVLGLAWVAEGRVDAFFHTSLNSWDALAGMLIVREAGGLSADAFGVDGLNERAPVLVSAPGIADELSQITGLLLHPKSRDHDR